jgi:hypothetical protein
MPLPDFLIIGAPKAGSTALHAALAEHPHLYAAKIKEPKYFMCDGTPPDRAAQRGPGDAHSAQEWVWQRPAYEALFADAPAGALRFESTPFYLWDRASHLRIAETLPSAKLIAVLRDPIDRAFSNWTHAWADGLEPCPDFLRACEAEPWRIADGWAPFWRYLELGRYGEQLEHLYRCFPREQVYVVRYRRLIDQPAEILDDICRFLGVSTGVLNHIPGSNVGRWAPHSPGNHALRKMIRAGAHAGSYVHPRHWRRAERALLRVLQRGSAPRPSLTREQRVALLGYYAEDNALLCRLLGEDYSDWLSPDGRGTYTERRSWAPSGPVASK